METAMGAVRVAAKIETWEDLFRHQRGELAEADVRHVDVDDALVDTGAFMLSLPHKFIDRLGLLVVRTQTARTTNGIVPRRIYGPVRLTILGRDTTCEVAELPDDCPVLIGQLPLEGLDFIVDPKRQRLIGNPEHGGEHMIDLF